MDSFDLDIFWGLIRTVVVLFLLAPLVYFSTKWYGGKKIKQGSLRIMEVLPLGAKGHLYVVKWEGERLLLGVTAQGISLIKQVAEDIEERQEPSHARDCNPDSKT